MTRLGLLLAAMAAAVAFVADSLEIPSGGAVDLSGLGLGSTVRLTVRPPETKRVALSLLNVSGNPSLEVIQMAGPLQVMQVSVLDLSGTAVSPTEQLIHFSERQSVMLSVRHVFINWTARPERPLRFAAFTDLLYRLRAESFAIDNWRVAEFEANFSQADNACQSKKFDSVTIRGAGIVRIVGAAVSATRSLDLRGNRIAIVANVTFHSGSVDLGHNRIAEMANVSFLPGTFCRTLITGPPEVRLNDNAVTSAALDAIAETRATTTLRGLDLSRNPLISARQQRQPPSGPPQSRQRIRISEWLRFDTVVVAASTDINVDDSTIERRLGDILSRFEPAAGPIRLDLSGNRLRSLAAVSRVLARADLRLGDVAGGLRLANNFLLADHLNLSELAPQPPAGVELELGDLSGTRIRSLSVVVSSPEGLRRCRDGEADFEFLQAEWSSRVDVRPRPAGCCAAQGTEQLFCFLHPERHRDYRRLLCGGDRRGRGGGGVGEGPDGAAGSQRAPSPVLVALSLVVAALAAAVVAAAVVSVRWRRRRRLRRALRKRGGSSCVAAGNVAEDAARLSLPRYDRGAS